MSRGAARRARAGNRTVVVTNIRSLAIVDGDLVEVPPSFFSYYTPKYSEAEGAVADLAANPGTQIAVIGRKADSLIERIRAGCVEAGLIEEAEPCMS